MDKENYKTNGVFVATKATSTKTRMSTPQRRALQRTQANLVLFSQPSLLAKKQGGEIKKLSNTSSYQGYKSDKDSTSSSKSSSISGHSDSSSRCSRTSSKSGSRERISKSIKSKRPREKLSSDDSSLKKKARLSSTKSASSHGLSSLEGADILGWRMWTRRERRAKAAILREEAAKRHEKGQDRLKKLDHRFRDFACWSKAEKRAKMEDLYKKSAAKETLEAKVQRKVVADAIEAILSAEDVHSRTTRHSVHSSRRSHDGGFITRPSNHHLADSSSEKIILK